MIKSGNYKDLSYAFHVKTVNNTRDVKILTNYLCTKKVTAVFPYKSI